MRARFSNSDLWFTAALFVVALLPRLFVAILWAKEPVWDGHYYHFGAERIAAGLGYSEDVIVNGQPVWKPWCHYPVGYSAFLGAVYRVFGSGLMVAPVVGAVVGALTSALVHRLARHSLSNTRARVAGGLVALHPGLIVYSALVMTEGLLALLLVFAPWLLLRLKSRPGIGSTAAGVVVGLATLVRPSSLLLAPLLGVIAKGSVRTRILVALGATVVATVTLLPWTVRNCRVMDGCALVSTNGGWNLAIGALTETGRFQTLRASDGCPVVTGQVQQDRCWGKLGRERILADPMAWLRLVPKKLSHTFDHESFAIEYLREADPASWPEARRVTGRHVLTTWHRGMVVLSALSLVSWVFLRKRPRQEHVWQGAVLALILGLGTLALASPTHPFFWLVVALPIVALLPLPGRPPQGAAERWAIGAIAATAFTHAVFFGDDRYHMVVSPLLCVLAAAALRAPANATDPPLGPAPKAR